MNKIAYGFLFGLAASLLLPFNAQAQLVVKENFNGPTLSDTTQTWLVLNGACLTASTSNTTFDPANPVPGVIPGCVDSGNNPNSYYSSKSSSLVGGATGANLPDATGHGALRLTNGASSGMSSTNGNNETGAIILANSFPSNSGLNITFNTYTWGGNAYGNSSGAKSGADGIAFFLLDASYYPHVHTSQGNIYSVSKTGAYGGSLGYDCAPGKYSSGNPTGGDGFKGAFLGLGIDEYGNFSNSGDNGNANDPNAPSALPNAIGIRGRGNITSDRFALDSNGNPVSPNPAASGFSGAVYTAKDVCTNGYYTGQSTSTTVTSITGDTNNPSSSTTSTSDAITVVSISNKSSQYSHGQTTYNYTTTTNVYPIVQVYDYYMMKSQAMVGNLYNQEYVAKPQREPITGKANTGAIPINYNINLTATGLLTIKYSYNGGAFTPVITNQNILQSYDSLPDNFLFGFSSGTGGGSNNHEITCFKAVQLQSSASSVGGDIPQNTRIKNGQGSQIYLASYNPLYWTGTVTATPLTVDSSTGAVTIAAISSWDAGCVLTGSTACQTMGQAAVTAQTNRAIAAWNDGVAAGTTTVSGTPGPVQFAMANLSSNQQWELNCGDPSASATHCDSLGAARVGFIIDNNTSRSGTADSVPVNTFRSRYSLLGDIVNSSPVWVGAPSSPYANAWVDLIDPSDTMVEGTSYGSSASSGYQKQQAALNGGLGRLNTVYVGANDGMLHGFSAGFGNESTWNPTDNSGTEIMAYMPSLAVNTIHNLVYGSGELDFPGLTYAHQSYVDATPGVGDIFWNGAWHTWLVGGLGAGGNMGGAIGGTVDPSTGTITAATANNGLGEIFAIDISNPILPENLNATSGAAVAANVMGDWNTNTIVCKTTTGTSTLCNTHLGSTYGTPLIRRMHSGNWAIIFGNGLNSAAGTAGIFVIEVTGTGTTPTYIAHYIDTGAGPSSDPTGNNTVNGISFVSAADLDGDHITDYVYAGDVLGNIWRFDMTSTSPGSWGASPLKIYSGPGSSTIPLQPITSALSINTIPYNGKNGVVINFGTGRQLPQTLTSLAGYAPSGQALYGIWDSNMDTWNAKKSTQYYSLASQPNISTGNLTQQTLTQVSLSANTTVNTSGASVAYADSNVTVCYPFIINCSSTGPGTSYGWYISMPNTQEQIIYNPVNENGIMFINSIIPPDQIKATSSCTYVTAGGYTYALSAADGGVAVDVFGKSTGVLNSNIAAVGVSGVGTPYFVSSTTASGDIVNTMITQTQSGTPNVQQVTLCSGVNCTGSTSSRLTWLELR